MRRQYQYPYEQYPEPEQHRWRLWLIIGVVLAAAVIVYFITKPAKIEEIIKEPISVVVPKTTPLTANVVFASAIDDDYNYELQPNAEYESGSPVYVYVEVSDFKTANSAVDITEDFEIKDLEGKTMFGKQNFASLTEIVSGTTETLMFRNIIPTKDWPAGRYTTTIRINDNLAKKSITKVLEFGIREKSEQKGFAVQSLIFANKADEWYRTQPNAVYFRDDTVYVYITLVNFTQPLKEGKYGLNIVQDAALYDENRNPLIVKPDHVTVDEMNEEKQENYNIINSFEISEFPKGKYIYRITAVDSNSNQTINREAMFTIAD